MLYEIIYTQIEHLLYNTRTLQFRQSPVVLYVVGMMR